MRAIIIDDKDSRALLDKLSLTAMEKRNLGSYNVSQEEAWLSLPESTRKDIIESIHRRFSYVVTSWLKDQGANFL